MVFNCWTAGSGWGGGGEEGWMCYRGACMCKLHDDDDGGVALGGRRRLSGREVEGRQWVGILGGNTAGID